MEKPARLATLDALRGVAAMLVMLFHMGPHAPLRAPGGYLAVDLFFTLSGFVLARAYNDRLRCGLGFGRFVALRLGRVMPLYALGIGIGLALVGGSPLALVLIPGTGGGDLLFPMNVVMWSLLFELVANAVYALIARRLGNVALGGLVAVGAIAVVAGGLARGNLDAGGFWSNAPLGLARTLFGFTLGIALFRLSQQQARPPRVTLLAWLLPASLSILLTMPATDRALTDLGCARVLLPALVWLGSRWELTAPRIGGWLGDLSYPLYCGHMPLVFVAGIVAPGTIASLAFVLPLAALALDRFYDRPLRTMLTSRRTAAGREAPASIRRASA